MDRHVFIMSCKLSPLEFSIGDNLHEMSNPVFWEKQEKYCKMLSAEMFTPAC